MERHVLQAREGPAAPRRPARVQHAFGPHRAGALHLHNRGASRRTRCTRLLPRPGRPRRRSWREFPFYHDQRRALLRVLPHGAPPWRHTMREFHPEPRGEGVARERPPNTACTTATGSGWRTTRARCKPDGRGVRGHSRTTAYRPSTAGGSPRRRGAAPYLYDCFDYNVNNLTRNFQAGPGGIGSPIKCTRCRIYKVPGRRHAMPESSDHSSAAAGATTTSRCKA